MKKYTGLPASADCIFSEFENKAPVGVKAAVRYNDLLKFKNLDKIKSIHRRDGFETSNADKIFESTYQKQVNK